MWLEYIRFPLGILENITTNEKGFNGIKLKNLYIIRDSNNRFIAKCGPVEYINISNKEKITTAFEITINEAQFKSFNEQTKQNIILHELGHALGIGIYWSQELTNGEHYIKNNLLRGTDEGFLNCLNGYRNITNNSNYNNIPLEDIGGVGTTNGHFEDSTRADNNITYEGTPNEIMRGFINDVISKTLKVTEVSIGALLDFGYERNNPDISGVNTLELANTLHLDNIEKNNYSNQLIKLDNCLDCVCNLHRSSF